MTSRPQSIEVTLPPLCADPFASNVTNTPITYKTLGASIYSSNKQHHEDANKILADKIMNKFLGHMPPDLFLQRYLLLDEPNLKCPESKWPEICKEVTEAEIYPLFVSLIPTLVSQPIMKYYNCKLHRYT